MYQQVKPWKTCLGANKHIINIPLFLGRRWTLITDCDSSPKLVNPSSIVTALGLLGCDREWNWWTGRNNKLGLFFAHFSKHLMLLKHCSEFQAPGSQNTPTWHSFENGNYAGWGTIVSWVQMYFQMSFSTFCGPKWLWAVNGKNTFNKWIFVKNLQQAYLQWRNSTTSE